jgi:hypothetical protein
MNRTIKRSKLKGQAAIEFLITYGWAITATMVVIAALVYFGITNPATSLPDKCTFSNGFDCRDYQVTSNTLKVKVVNILGETMYGSGGTSTITAVLSDTGAACTVTGGNPATLDPDVDMEITCNNLPDGPFNAKEKAKVKVTINYAKSAGGYNQISLGEVYATVQ